MLVAREPKTMSPSPVAARDVRPPEQAGLRRRRACRSWWVARGELLRHGAVDATADAGRRWEEHRFRGEARVRGCFALVDQLVSCHRELASGLDAQRPCDANKEIVQNSSAIRHAVPGRVVVIKGALHPGHRGAVEGS